MKNLTRRFLSIVLCCLLICSVPVISSAETSDFSIGDKITLGNYNNEPITWVCILIDDNGPLFLSEKVLCKKEYDAAGESSIYHTDGWGYIRKQRGSNCWADSSIRQWLNTSGDVEYTHCPPSYKEEDGFLTGFTAAELNAIKTVTQKTNLNEWDAAHREGYLDGGQYESTDKYTISGLKDVIKSDYWYQNVTDRVFLLDERQVYQGYNNLPDVISAMEYCTRISNNGGASYENVRKVSGSDYYLGTIGACDSGNIRPAIYIDATKKVNNGLVKGSYTWQSDNQIRINSTWYDIDENVEGLKSYISKLSLFTQVSCYVKNGAVVACSTADVPVKTLFSVSPSDRNIKFDAKSSSFSKESMQLSVNIANSMKEKGVGWEALESMSFTFDSFSIYVDEPMYFKNGLFGLSKTNSYTVKLENPVTIYPGHSYNIDEEINVFFDSDKMSETVKDVYGNAEANISLSVSNSGNSVGSAGNFVTITDNQIQNNAVNASALDSSYASAGSQLNSCISSIKLENEFLREIFSDNDWNAIKTDIVCKAILKEIPKSSYENANISKKALNKLIGKIGVNTSIIPVMRTETITTRAFVSSEKYGDMEVEISVKMNYPAVGNDGAFAAYSLGTADYKIKGSKKVPADKRSGTCTCMIALADISQFASSVERVSMSEIENAYNMCYGNDLNQVCDMFFGNVVTKIISKTKFKSYSHALFKLLSYPSTAVSIYCPVDVYVYNDSGELCASVVDNEAECSDENITIDVNGDEKTVKVYGEDYSIKLVGTAYSAMDVEVVNYASYNDTLRTVHYNNVELEPGKAFSLDVKDDDYSSNNYDITVNENETIKPDSDSFSVHRASPGDWEVQRAATCTKTGLSVKKCTVCGEIVETKETRALGHVDDNGDKICDRCGEDITDIQKNCKHLCHSSNRFLKFIWKIVNFIHRIFGINKHCSCGLKHY